jgi:hypothetical protein
LAEFPRGWLFSVNVGMGSTASLTVPATVGVVHVLDAFQALLFAQAAAAAAAAATINITAPALVIGLLGFNGGAVGADSASASGMDIATAPGAALTVSFSVAAPANYQHFLMIQGHDI